MYRVAIITAAGIVAEYEGDEIGRTWDKKTGKIEGMLTLFNATSLKSGRKLYSVCFPIHRALIETIKKKGGKK